MARTFSGTYTTTQVLSNPATDNPVTVAGTGLINVNSTSAYAAGIFGNSGTAWTLSNFGTVESIGSKGIGVNLQSGGTITNGASNLTSGLIAGSLDGIDIQGSAGTITNFGTIASTTTGTTGSAIALSAGGLVTNYGLIVGARAPNVIGTATGYGGVITTSTISATVQNFGTIASSAINVSTGINLLHGGLIINGATNATGALIAGSHDGIYAGGHLLSTGTAASYPGALATVVNYGTITGGSGQGVLLNEGGTVLNSGVISNVSTAHAGVSVHNVAGTVVNSGTIESTGNQGVYFQLGGSVGNSAGGLISGGDDGVQVLGSAGTAVALGTVVNSGTIRSTGITSGAGVNFEQGGILTNQADGTIAAYRTGVSVNGSVGAVANAGTILSTGTDFDGVYLGAGGTVTNALGALIESGWNGVSLSNVAGTVINYGTIDSTASVVNSGTLDGVAARLGDGGLLVNGASGSTGALITGDEFGITIGTKNGIPQPGAVGTVINYGTIASTGTGTVASPALRLGAGGTVTNRGIIDSAASNAVAVIGSVAATVSNFGLIENFSTSPAAIYSAAGGVISNAAGATIESTRNAISLHDAAGTTVSFGSVVNSGTIESTGVTAGSGVYFGQGGVVTNQAGGLITANRTGIFFGNTAGTADNFGTIVSTAALSAASGAGIYLGAGGVITNEAGAAVTAVRAAVSLAFFGTTSAAATVTNSGTLLGNTGISIGAGDTGDNTIVNFGTIIGTSGTAVSLGSGDDRVVIEAGSGFNGAIGNFHPGDTFDLPFLSFSGSGTVTLGINNVLQIVAGGSPIDIDLDPAQSFAGDFFHLAGDGGTGTLVTENQSASAGSKLAFFAGGQTVNLGLTPDGGNLPAPVAGDFNIEVFTATAGSLAAGYQAAVLVPGAAALDSNEVQSATGSEELLAGSYLVIDRTGEESLQIVGNAAGGSSITVVGSLGDTIAGSTVAGNAQLIEAIPNADAVSGPMTVIGGAGATTVWGGTGDSIAGGAGAITVDGHAGANDTIVGGGGAMTVYGAAGDSILGGGGALLVNENQGLSGLEKIAGGSGSLTALDLGRNDTIGGSTGGTTFIDDSYGAGGGSLIAGGSGSAGTLAGGENSFIKAAFGDTVTGGADLTLIDATAGGDSILGGAGTVAGAIAGLSVAVNTAIEGGGGDTIAGGAGASYIDASAGAQTIAGGAGATTVLAGRGDHIAGGAGALRVIDPNASGFSSIAGGIGNLTVFDIGRSDTITGSTAGTTFVNDTYTGTALGGFSLISGGSGTVSGAANPAGGAAIGANTWIIGQAGDTILGGSGNMYVDAGSGSESITGGSSTLAVTIPSLQTASGGTAIQGGNLDTITGGSGTLQLYINSNVGAETVNLGAGHGAAALRDIDVGAAGATTSVTGFNTATDLIQSKSGVDAQGVFLGTSKSDGSGGTILSFVDGSTMTLAGIASIGAIKFTQ